MEVILNNNAGVVATDENPTMHFYSQDLQLQTEHSDGRCSIDEIVQGSIAQGRTTIGITDHAIGWDDGDEHCRFFETAAEFESYLADIRLAKETYKAQGITVLAGLEVEIGLDGRMALAPGILEVIGSEANILQHIDYVIGVIHSESFTVSLEALGKSISDTEKSKLLLQNIAALIAHPDVLIWGHPFQVVHGHFLRDYTASERQSILASLRARTTPLLLEYNLNPTPRYEEWQGKSTHYETGRLIPNDEVLFTECIEQLNSQFVVSTDAHDVAQTARLNAETVVPAAIVNRIVYIDSSGVRDETS